MQFSVGRVGHQTMLRPLGSLSERDHIIITTLAYSRLLNWGNSLVKSDVSMVSLSSVRALEQWESEDEPQGTGTLDGRENRHCQ